MTDKELQEQLNKLIRKDDFFIKDVHAVLVEFKTSGGQQQNAKKCVEQLATDLSNNENLQDRAFDILDIVTGWCQQELKIWEKQNSEILKDGLQFEDNESGVVFNHFSFCELIKHIMVKYGKIDYPLANEKLRNSYLSKTPRTLQDVEFITHELQFHWAMLLVHGDMYWTKGIPSDTNEFMEEYSNWVSEINQKFNLKEPYNYFEKES